MGFFSTTIKPTIPIAQQIQSNTSHKAFAAADLFFDWTAFDIPKGAARLVGVSILVRGVDGAANTARDFQLVFAKGDANGDAPSSLGTENSTVDGVGWFNHALGRLYINDTNYSQSIDTMLVGTIGFGSSTDHGPVSMVLQGEPDSGTNVGYDKLYVAGIGGSSNTWAFQTNVAADGAVSDGAATDITVKTTDARNVFAVGDVIHVHDSETAIGTIKSIDDATSIILESANGVAIADDDEIMNANPITVILSFEQ